MACRSGSTPAARPTPSSCMNRLEPEDVERVRVLRLARQRRARQRRRLLPARCAKRTPLSSRSGPAALRTRRAHSAEQRRPRVRILARAISAIARARLLVTRRSPPAPVGRFNDASLAAVLVSACGVGDGAWRSGGRITSDQ